MYFNRYCDNCGEKKALKQIVLGDESGTAFYCDNCRKANKRQTVEEWKKGNEG